MLTPSASSEVGSDIGSSVSQVWYIADPVETKQAVGHFNCAGVSKAQAFGASSLVAPSVGSGDPWVNTVASPAPLTMDAPHWEPKW